MTSSNGNIFRVTGHLCAEFTGDRWIPRTNASDAALRYRSHYDVIVMSMTCVGSWMVNICLSLPFYLSICPSVSHIVKIRNIPQCAIVLLSQKDFYYEIYKPETLSWCRSDVMTSSFIHSNRTYIYVNIRIFCKTTKTPGFYILVTIFIIHVHVYLHT